MYFDKSKRKAWGQQLNNCYSTKLKRDIYLTKTLITQIKENAFSDEYFKNLNRH